MYKGFVIRSYQRFALGCRVYYRGHGVVGQGTVWNVSQNGWRVDGDCSVIPGDALNLCVHLPRRRGLIMVDQAVVRWSRGQEFGLEIVEMPADDHARLNNLVKSLLCRPYVKRP